MDNILKCLDNPYNNCVKLLKSLPDSTRFNNVYGEKFVFSYLNITACNIHNITHRIFKAVCET